MGEFADWDSYKDPSYRDMYDEAHRRSPTPIKTPVISTHFAIWHPGKFSSTFQWYIRCILVFLDRLQPEARQRPDNIHKWVRQIYLYYHDQENVSLVEKLVFNFEEDTREGRRVLWRLEVHREYCSITIFYELDKADLNEIASEKLTPESADNINACPRINAIFLELTARKLHCTEYVRNGLVKFFYAYARAIVENRHIGAEVSKAIETDELPKRDALTEEEHESFNVLVNANLPKILLDYFGVILPISTFKSGFGQSQDVFPDIESHGFTDKPAATPAKMRAANLFLSERLASPLLRQKLIRNANILNVVACFLFNGHFLYVSSIGHRIDSDDKTPEPDNSPSTFWLFYKDFNRSRAHGEDGYLASSTDRRASRLIYNLHTIATVRIAALYNMKAMKDFSQRLRRLELMALNLRKNTGKDAIKQSLAFREQLVAAEERVGESIIYRAARTGYYLSIMRTLVEDSTIVSIPSWQNLENFIRRRLEPSLGYLAGLGARYEALNDLFSAEYTLNIGGQIYEFQKIADMLFYVLALYYAPHAMENIGKLFQIAPEALTHAAEVVFFVDDPTVKGPWSYMRYLGRHAAENTDCLVSALPEIFLTAGVIGVAVFAFIRHRHALARWLGLAPRTAAVAPAKAPPISPV